MAELVHFLVPDSEISRWREEAHALGLSLTALVRARMNGDRSSDSLRTSKGARDARQAAREEVRQVAWSAAFKREQKGFVR